MFTEFSKVFNDYFKSVITMNVVHVIVVGDLELTEGKLIPSLRVNSKVLLAQNQSFAT